MISHKDRINDIIHLIKNNKLEQAKLALEAEMITKCEPKKQHRFVLYIEDVPSWLIKSVDLPKQLKFKTGKLCSDEVHTMTLYDSVIPSGTKIVLNWLSGTSPKEFQVIGIGPMGDEIARWTCDINIVSVDFDTLKWEDDASTEIKVRFKFKEIKYEEINDERKLK